MLDHARIAERFAAPRVHADLAEVGYEDPVRALATLAASGNVLAEFGAVPAMTDEHPVLEFHPIPAGVQLKHLWENLGAMRELRVLNGELPVDTRGEGSLDDRYAVAQQVGDLILEGQHLLEEAGLLGRAGRGDRATQSLRGARRAFAHATALDPGDAAARRAFESLEREWRTMTANAHLRAEDLGEAERVLRDALGYRTEHQRDVVPTLLAPR